ncbi:tetraspanin-11-like protein [Dermatophagoides farinae]|uniref:Tetraspanin n=1 Tax=Dermatophagoides farinae TaxID=6954 RepID=A0A9D4NVJ1_DERFA|nr:tetraspanin-11-like protein [Dermatophagoides farinae]
MVDGGVGKGIKFAMFAANGVIFVGGLVVFAIGVWTLADRSFMERLLGSNLYITSASLLIAADTIYVVGIFVLLFLIFILMLLGGILGYVFRNQVDDRMKREMQITISHYGNDSAITDAWDSVQRNFHCCGIELDGQHGYTIYRQNNPIFGSNNRRRVPRTCCLNLRDESSVERCMMEPENPTHTYHDDCYDRMKNFVKGHAMLVGGIGIGIACILIIGMVLSMALFCMID